jgi:hypothetical protein
VRQEHPVDDAVRQVEHAADLVAHRVRGAEDRVGERQARLERGLGHAGARRDVVGAVDGAGQVAVDHRDRLQRVVVGERAVGERDEGLDAVREGVEPGGGAERVGHRGEQPRVDHRDVRHQRPAHDGDLGVPHGVGDDAELGDVGAGARRGRHHDQRRDGVLDAVDALEVEDAAAVGREQGHALRRVDHGAAADAEHHVAARLAVALVPGLDLVVLGVGGDVVPDHRVEPRRP